MGKDHPQNQQGPETPASSAIARPGAPLPASDLPEDITAASNAPKLANDLDLEFGELDTFSQATALLGFTKDLEIKDIPPTGAVARIDCPLDQLEVTQNIFKGYGVILSSQLQADFQSNNYATFYLLVERQSNMETFFADILDYYDSDLSQAHISLLQSGSILVGTKKHGVMVLGQSAPLNIVKKGGPGPLLPPQKQTFLKTLGYEMSPNSINKAKENKPKLPSQKPCSYLAIPLDKLQRTDLSKIIAYLSPLINSKDIEIGTYNNTFFMINTAERSGNYLALISQDIFKALNKKTSVFLCNGETTENPAPGNFKTFGLSTIKDATSCPSALKPGVFQRDNVLEDRDRSLIDFALRDTPDPTLKQILNCKSKVNFATGGPESMIGYEKELEDAYEYLTDPDTKVLLLVLKAKAGMGKSKFLSELSKRIPNVFALSIDPAGKGVAGFSLATLTDQLINLTLERIPMLEKSQELNKETLDFFISFKKASQDQKIRLVQEDPNRIIGLFISILSMFAKEGKPPRVFIDDLHHADKFSDEMIREILLLLPQDVKIVLSMRGDEIENQEKQKESFHQLEKLYPNSVREISITGLDFENKDKDAEGKTIMERYVLGYPQLKQYRDYQLGNGFDKLAKLADSWPLAMTAYLNFLINTPRGLDYDNVNKIIHIDDLILEELMEITKDKGIYGLIANRIEKLPAAAKSIMKIIALLGGKLSFTEIKKLAKDLFGIEKDEVEKAIKELIEKDILIQDDEKSGMVQGLLGKVVKGMRVYKLFHDNTRTHIIKTINDEERRTLSLELYEFSKNLNSIHPDIQLDLLINAAETAPIYDNAAFWQEFYEKTSAALDDAENMNAFGRAYLLCKKILADLATANMNNSIYQCVDALETNKDIHKIPKAIKDLIMKTAFSMARNAIMFGKFNDAYLATSTLETLCTYNPEFRARAKEIYLLFFEIHSIKAEDELLQDVYQNKFLAPISIGNRLPLETIGPLIDQMTPHEKALMEMKLLFRQNQFGNLIKLYKKHENEFIKHEETYKKSHNGKSSPEFIEAQVLVDIVVPTEKVIWDCKRSDKKPDGDIYYDPSFYTEEQRTELLRIVNQTDKMKKDKKVFLRPFSDLHASIQKGQALAMLGEYDSSVKTLDECWRNANRLDIHAAALKSAFLKGNIEMMQAGARGKPELLDKEKIKQALSTYTKQGLLSAEQVSEDDFYQLAIRIQILRAVSMLAESYQADIQQAQESGLTRNEQWLSDIKKDLKPYIEIAIESYQYLGEKCQFDHAKNDQTKDGRIQYYLASSMEQILETIEKLKLDQSTAPVDYGAVMTEISTTGTSTLTLPLIHKLISKEHSPFSDKYGIEQAIEYGQKDRNADHLGERDVKLENLLAFLRRIETAEVFASASTESILSGIGSAIDRAVSAEAQTAPPPSIEAEGANIKKD